MEILPLESISYYINNNVNNVAFSLPASINSICPECNYIVCFTFYPRNYDSNTKLLIGESSCPRCKFRPKFIIEEPVTANTKDKKIKNLFIHPSPKGKKVPIDFQTEIKQLKTAYLSAIDSYNENLWNPTVTMCRRVLEGITKTILSEDETKNKSLYEQLKLLPKNVKLEEPILKIADLIREGGNLGAHFDLQKEADESTSSELIDMLEYLIEYIYLLPNKIEMLKEKINSEEKEVI
jgi:hypothetical protein